MKPAIPLHLCSLNYIYSRSSGLIAFRQGFENKVNKPLGVFLDCLAWDNVGMNCLRITVLIRLT